MCIQTTFYSSLNKFISLVYPHEYIIFFQKQEIFYLVMFHQLFTGLLVHPTDKTEKDRRVNAYTVCHVKHVKRCTLEKLEGVWARDSMNTGRIVIPSQKGGK